MSRLEIEVPSVVVGFALGGACLVAHGLVCRLTSAPCKAKATGKEQDERDACRDRSAAAAATAEPLPEPSPEPAAAAQRRQPRIVRPLLLALAALLAAGHLLLRAPSAPSSLAPVELVAIAEGPAAATEAQEVVEPVAATQVPEAEEVAAPVAVAAAEVPFSKASTELLPAEAAETAVVAMTAGESGAVGEMCEVQAAENTCEASAKQGAQGDAGLLTLKLTRQQLTLQQDEGIYYKTAYWGTVSVGEPAMNFSVVFDTGSGHLILPSTYCHSETCRAHKRYRRSNSVTAKDIDYDGILVQPGELRDHITVSFGTGEVTGVFIEDMVCLGHTATPGQRIFNDSLAESVSTSGAIVSQRSGKLPSDCMGLRMIAATDMSEDPFNDFEFDGVLGLGLNGLSQSPEFNPVHIISTMAMEAKGRDPHMFSVFLAQNDNEESEITFGGYAPAKTEEDVAWHPVYDPTLGQWMVKIKSVRIDDGEPIEFCRDGSCRAIVDTGTSLIAVPTTVFPELFELLLHPAEAEECTGPGPKFHIELESITVTLEPRDYALVEKGTKSRVRALITQDPDEAEDDMCKAMLMAMDLPAPLGPKVFILGEPVLRRYYTIYDSSATPRVGFARARHEGEVQ
uniref:Peptidase A1 domain-containing protein n=1 Tax=Alexandrium andersonii TaxID=327968 RepID=A0A7S2B2T3_9DINO|mmetsp:Transcript_21501/g.48972  ORF Transcript_21501/g.48972 Transcript_21501/m.48972 type:complete len:625 (+) Transcript_21501:141-2015(+)